MSDVPVHQENLTSVALDGARISAFVALQVLDADTELQPLLKASILTAMGDAIDSLNFARELLPVITTSVHIVKG